MCASYRSEPLTVIKPWNLGCHTHFHNLEVKRNPLVPHTWLQIFWSLYDTCSCSSVDPKNDDMPFSFHCSHALPRFIINVTFHVMWPLTCSNLGDEAALCITNMVTCSFLSVGFSESQKHKNCLFGFYNPHNIFGATFHAMHMGLSYLINAAIGPQNGSNLYDELLNSNQQW